MSTPEQQTGWTARRLRIALLVSLAVNLMGVGLIIGAVLAGPPRRPHTEFGLMSFSHTLPADRAEVLKSNFKTQRPRIRELRQAARSARLEATETLIAETYDAEKIRTSLAKIDEAETKLRALMSETFIDAAGKLTQAERQQLAKWWKKRQPRLFWRKDDQQKEKDAPNPKEE